MAYFLQPWAVELDVIMCHQDNLHRRLRLAQQQQPSRQLLVPSRVLSQWVVRQ